MMNSLLESITRRRKRRKAKATGSSLAAKKMTTVISASSKSQRIHRRKSESIKTLMDHNVTSTLTTMTRSRCRMQMEVQSLQPLAIANSTADSGEASRRYRMAGQSSPSPRRTVSSLAIILLTPSRGRRRRSLLTQATSLSRTITF